MFPLLLLLVTSGCSIRRYAINQIGDALASGSSTYASDEDLELVGEALPFGLKLIESLLAEAPKHKGLLLAACEGFTGYTWVYVQQEGDRVAQDDLQRARQIRTRPANSTCAPTAMAFADWKPLTRESPSNWRRTPRVHSLW